MSASGAQFEREEGRQGQAPAIGPANDRMIQSVAGRPPFSAYFTFDAILRQLVKWRVRAMARRREDAYYAARLKGQAKPEDAVACEAAKYLPPRNAWKRPPAAKRGRKSAEQIATQSIVRTVHGFMNARPPCGGMRPEWARNLDGLVEAVNGRIEARGAACGALEPPIMFLKKKDADSYRALATYGKIDERVILGGVSAYLRRMFDPHVSRHCHSFREDSSRSHQSAVAELIAYRKAHAGETLHVAECDIMKFFDAVDHAEVRKAYEAFVAKCGGAVDERAGEWVSQYLSSYTFEGAMEAAGKGRAGRPPLPAEMAAKVGRVPKAALAAVHSGEDLAGLELGLPQGGALSPLFANILLAEADDAVVGDDADPDLLYIRFCDDMIIVHPNPEKCRAAMQRYLEAVKRRKLPVHPASDGGFAYGAEYYGLKTKGPFAWRPAKAGERDAAPWVSFLGYQVNCDGETRVRKETVRKHLRSMKGERVRFDRRVAGVVEGADRPRIVRHFKAHLIAKGIGFLKAGAIRDDSLCWAAAFPNLKATASRECLMQMRVLDAVRDRTMRFPEEAAAGGRHFFGRPFSYLGYLMREARPARCKGGATTCSDLRVYGQI